MLFSSWLRNCKSSLERRAELRQTRRTRRISRRTTSRPYLEVLEDRTLLSLTMSVNNLAVSGSNGAVVNNGGSFIDSTAGATVTLTASAGTVAQNSNGTWSWSETTPAGAAQTAPVTIFATDSNGQTAASEFWLNVGQVFIVNTTADTAAANLTTGQDSSGNISLRSAIQAANATNASTPALIAFQIPGTGPFTIQPQSALDPITAPVIIDGYTEPGTSPNTNAMGDPNHPSDNAVRLIVLDGSQAPINTFTLLSINGANSTIRGLQIQNAPANAIYSGTSGNVIEGNYIGIGGGNGIFIGGTSNNTIGGTDPSARNIIAASRDGIFINSLNPEPGNIIEGNYIGLDASGTAVISGLGVEGVVIGGGKGDTIGGTTTTARNVISGWQSEQVELDGPQLGPIPNQDANVVEGNYIGTNAAGAVFASNPASTAIGIGGYYNNAVISNNLISGLGTALNIGASGYRIQGNTIASNDGPAIVSGQGEQIVGNSIFNNAGPAVEVYGTDDAIEGNSIYGNGGPAIDNLGQYGDNLLPPLVDTNVTGGPFTGTDNSTITGLTLTYNNGTLTYNNGTLSGLPNTRYLVTLNATSSDGKYWGSYYIFLTTDPVSGKASISNLLYQTPSGFSTTQDTWAGAAQSYVAHSLGNYEQNSPVLNSVSSSASDTSISGTLNGQANTTFRIEFFSNPAEDPSGYGQGQTYLGYTNVTTDANGNVTFTTDLATGNLSGQWITATATDPNGNTSEFSADIQATAAPSQTYAQYLQAAVPQSSSTANSMTIYASSSVPPSTVINAVNVLTNITQPATIILDLGGGTYSSGGAVANPPPNVTFVVQNGTLDPNYPALTVGGGLIVVSNCTLTTSGSTPTLLVTGGNVTLSNDTINQTSTTSVEPAISVTGGTVNLGTPSAPGNNTLSVNSSGDLVSNTSGNPISAVGDTFLVGGTVDSAANLSFTTLASNTATSIFAQAVTLTATVQANGSSATPAGSIDFFDATTNTNLGSVPLSGGIATLTTSALAPGNHMIVAKYGGEANFLPSANTFTQNVRYRFSGFLPPLNNGLSFAANRTIPIKFNLSDYNDNAITSLSAVTSLQIQAVDANGNPVGAPFTPASTNKQGLQYSGGQYQFNWQIKGLGAGSYEIVLKLTDGTTQTQTIQLTAGGSSAGLVTDGSGGTASAGALLGGEVDLYVDDSNGDLTSDELARINDAVTSMDTTIAPYGVTIVAVGDPTQANVRLSMNTTSALGGFTQGVLGCTTDADQVTMIQGWNWYAGADPTQVGSGQYDFETAVMHELGHVLGLGHSSDSSSVMYASLAAGTANRTLVNADLNVPDDDSGSCALHAAPTAAVGSLSNRQGVTVSSSTSSSGSGSTMSAADQVLVSLSLLLSDARNAYQSELSSVSALWQGVHALALQRLDGLVSLEASAMGVSKDTLMRDLFLARLSSSNG